MNKTTRLLMIRLLVIAFAVESIICNFSAWKSLFYRDRRFYDNMEITGGERTEDRYLVPDGVLTLRIEDMHMNVHDLFFACGFSESGAPVSYTVSLTDGGNYYPYPLPEQVLMPTVPKSYYTELYPAGQVDSVTVEFTVPAGSTVTVHGIGVNARIPFSFSLGRFLVILGTLCLFAFAARPALWQQYPCAGTLRQRIMTAAAVVLLIGAAFCLSRINPRCVDSPWPHHRQYQELAQSLAKGQFYLDAQPSEELMQVENPYDTIYLQANQIDYLADYVYYEGKYYVYFGIVPELLLYLPAYLLTGQHMANYMAVFLFYSGFIAAVFVLCGEIIKKWFPRTPYFLYLALCVLTVCCGNYLFIIARPDLYDTPIMAANMFTVWGLALWIKGTRTEPAARRKFLFALGSLCMALVAGCRPQMLLFSFLAFPLLWKEYRKKPGDVLSICLPYVFTAALIMYYNAARFESPFDFGASYSLTSNDMTKRSFHLEQALLGLWHYIFRPPVLTSDFPFLQGVQIRSASYMGRLNSEYTYGGILAGNVFLWILFSARQAKKTLREKNLCALTGISAAVSVILIVVDVTYAGILQRYMDDMVWGFWFAAILLALVWIEKASESGRLRAISVSLAVVCLLQAVYGFGILFGTGDTGTNLQICNPGLYYHVQDLLRF